jgi:hypothetical protein
MRATKRVTNSLAASDARSSSNRVKFGHTTGVATTATASLRCLRRRSFKRNVIFSLIFLIFFFFCFSLQLWLELRHRMACTRLACHLARAKRRDDDFSSSYCIDSKRIRLFSRLMPHASRHPPCRGLCAKPFRTLKLAFWLLDTRSCKNFTHTHTHTHTHTYKKMFQSSNENEH